MKSGWGAHGVHSEARTARAMTRLAHHQRMCFDPFSPVEHISCAQNKHTCAGCGGVRKEVRTLSGPGMLRGFMIAVTAARQPSAASRGPPSTSTPLLRPKESLAFPDVSQRGFKLFESCNLANKSCPLQLPRLPAAVGCCSSLAHLVGIDISRTRFDHENATRIVWSTLVEVQAP